MLKQWISYVSGFLCAWTDEEVNQNFDCSKYCKFCGETFTGWNSLTQTVWVISECWLLQTCNLSQFRFYFTHSGNNQFYRSEVDDGKATFWFKFYLYSCIFEFDASLHWWLLPWWWVCAAVYRWCCYFYDIAMLLSWDDDYCLMRGDICMILSTIILKCYDT